MTHTAEDMAFALAALDAPGAEVTVGAIKRTNGTTGFFAGVPYGTNSHGETLRKALPVAWDETLDTAILALAAAGRVLGLKPKWVVVPVEDVISAAQIVSACAYAYAYEDKASRANRCKRFESETLFRRWANDSHALADRLSVLADALSSTPSRDGDTT